MNINWSDPIFWICCGILAVGFLSLLWALAKLFRPALKTAAEGELDVQSGAEPVREEESTLSALRERGARQPVSAAPAMQGGSPADMTHRLEVMAKRLAEMQALLDQQAAQPAAAPGQGFSPETIEKLLKIIGNVIQQVDVLQSSLNPPPAASSEQGTSSGAAAGMQETPPRLL